MIPLLLSAAIVLSPYGPGTTGGFSPEYTKPIRVIDTVPSTIRRPSRRKAWIAARDKALGVWAADGTVAFDVERQPESSLAYRYDDNVGVVGLSGMLIPNAIVLTRSYLTEGFQSQGGWDEQAQGGLAAVWLPPLWWGAEYEPFLVSLIAHEMGHALGFGHGGTGIMAVPGNWPTVPNAEDLALLDAYWGTR